MYLLRSGVFVQQTLLAIYIVPKKKKSFVSVVILFSFPGRGHESYDMINYMSVFIGLNIHNRFVLLH